MAWPAQLHGLAIPLANRRYVNVNTCPWFAVMASQGRVIVYGGKGALGATIVNFFRSKSWVCVILHQSACGCLIAKAFLCAESMASGVATKLVVSVSMLKPSETGGRRLCWWEPGRVNFATVFLVFVVQ